jgi:hypothetical protein
MWRTWPFSAKSNRIDGSAASQSWTISIVALKVSIPWYDRPTLYTISVVTNACEIQAGTPADEQKQKTGESHGGGCCNYFSLLEKSMTLITISATMAFPRKKGEQNFRFARTVEKHTCFG